MEGLILKNFVVQFSVLLFRRVIIRKKGINEVYFLKQTGKISPFTNRYFSRSLVLIF